VPYIVRRQYCNETGGAGRRGFLVGQTAESLPQALVVELAMRRAAEIAVTPPNCLPAAVQAAHARSPFAIFTVQV
jgi:hypothetical protein